MNGSNGPFMLVGARSFGRIAAMRLTAARSPKQTLDGPLGAAMRRMTSLGPDLPSSDRSSAASAFVRCQPNFSAVLSFLKQAMKACSLVSPATFMLPSRMLELRKNGSDRIHFNYSRLAPAKMTMIVAILA